MSTDTSAKGWFYVDANREQQGPYSVPKFQELANQGLILSDTLVWSPAYGEAWVKASSVKGLVPDTPPAPAPSPATVPPSLPTPQPKKNQSFSNPLTKEEPAEEPSPELEPLPDEQLKPRRGSFLFSRLLTGFGLSLLLAIITAAVCFAFEQTPFIGAGVFILLFAFTIFAALIAYRKERYELTKSTVLCHQGGLVSDQTTEVEICKITHVAMKRPWLRHKLFGIGTIEIESAGTSKPIVLMAIHSPEAVYERIEERMKRNGYQLEKKELLHEESPAIRGILVNSLQAIGSVLLALVLGGATITGAHQTLAEVGFEWILPLIAVLFTLTAFGYFVIYFLDMRRRTYRVFDDTVIYEEGFLTRRNAFIPYENIADAATNRTFLDQIFNLFDVVISCQGSSTDIKFRRLKNGEQLSECIERLVSEASSKPSPAEQLATLQSHSDESEGSAKKNLSLVQPGREWVEDLHMHPSRVFIPLLALIPLFPLWIMAMIQAVIKLRSTKYAVRAHSIKHSYRFLTTNEREFAYDKITGLVIKENLLDRMLGTFTLRLWSIGSGQSLELAHVHRSLVDLDALLRQIGIPTNSQQSHHVPTRFGLWAWMRARCYRFIGAFVLMIGFAAAALFLEENLLFIGAAIIPLIILFALGHAWIFYSKQQLIFLDHHVEAAQGIFNQQSYFARYHNIKQNLVTCYPGGKDGSLKIFVAGEQTLNQQSKKGIQIKATVPCSFTLDFLPNAMKQGQLLDDILGGRVEVTPECQPAEPMKTITESSRGQGNAITSLLFLSIVALPLVVLLPITLSLTILSTKKWRYRVEEKRIVNSWGLLFKRRASILLDRVDSLEQKQKLFNKVFKNGTISIMTAGSSRPDLVMPAVKSYQTLYQAIRERSRKR